MKRCGPLGNDDRGGTRPSHASAAGHEERSEINLTPMLDVVFILLIFFIVTASFIRETGIEVQPPDRDPPVRTDTPAAILVVISESDALMVDGRSVGLRALPGELRARAAGQPEAALVVEPADGSRVATLVAVLDATRRSSIRDVRVVRAP